MTDGTSFGNEDTKMNFGYSVEIILGLLERGIPWIAEQTGLKPYHLNSIKRGDGPLTSRHAESIASCLGVSVEDMAKSHDDENAWEDFWKGKLTALGFLGTDGKLVSTTSIMNGTLARADAHASNREAEMADGNQTFHDGILEHATQLATATGLHLEHHTLDTYEGLLRDVYADHYGLVDEPNFVAVSRFVCIQLLNLNKNGVRARCAATALLMIALSGKKPGEVELDVDLLSGTLAKLKHDKGGELSPVNVVSLAVELEVPIPLLFEDFSDNPEGLRERLAACGAIRRNGDEDDISDGSAGVEGVSEDASGRAVIDVDAGQEILDAADAGDDTAGDGEASVDDHVGADDADDADDADAGVALHLLEPVWNGEFVVSLGMTTFNLREKDVRNKVMGALRATNPHPSLKHLVEDAAGLTDKSTGWFSGVQKGLGLIRREELEALVEACGEDVTIGIILTGYDLDPAKMAMPGRGGGTPSHALVPVGLVAITLPAITEQDIQTFFRERFERLLAAKSGITDTGFVMELALAHVADTQIDIDFVEAWLGRTENGIKMEQSLDRMAADLRIGGDTFKVAMLMCLVGKVFSATPEDAEGRCGGSTIL